MPRADAAKLTTVRSSKASTGLTGPPVLDGGRVEVAVLADLQSLGVTDSALGQVALALARELDAGAGMATAAVARELRATLAALSDDVGEGDIDAIAELVARLSAPVGD